MTEMSTLILSFDLPHSPATVWRALTEPDLLARWLMKTDLLAQVGHVFQFQRPAMEHWDGIVNCEVLKVDEGRFISYTWRALGVDTVVSFTLDETVTGTRLKLEQSGFKTGQKQAFGGARGGWNHMAGHMLPLVLAEESKQ